MEPEHVISIITPIFEPVPQYLEAAYRSICAQSLPDGWNWEWVIQEDGRTGVASRILPDDPRLSFGEGRHNGVAITRNLGLARAQGRIVKNLDQDDILTDGVISRDISVLSTFPNVEWVTSRVLDLLPDGSTVSFPDDPPEGLLKPGMVHAHWQTHNYRLPVHPTTICIRRRLLSALGGWMAVPGSDDTGLLIAASIVSTGYFNADVGLLYRKWHGQVTASPEHMEPVEWNLRMQLINERAESLIQTNSVAPSGTVLAE